MLRTIVRVLKTPVTLVALVALVAFGASWGWANTIAPIPPRAPDPCVTQNVGAKLTPNRVQLRLLNGGFRGGAAKRMATEMRSYGFNVVKIGNTPDRIQTTTIVGFSADSPEVRLVAGFFKDPVIKPDARPDHSVDVLIGATFPGYTAKPATSVVLPDGTACLPKPEGSPLPSAASTPTPSVSPSATPSATPSKK